MTTAVSVNPIEVVRNEVARFSETARQRSESDPVPRRRARRRYHRSWPLVVNANGTDISAALHNACDDGLAFLSCCPVPVDAVVFIRLFCYEEEGPRVPALVRHITPHEHGFLVGCAFLIDNEELCRQAVNANARSAT